jgi:signal transduction histidine kinase
MTEPAIITDAPAISADESALYSEFDRERGVRLARIVGLTFTGIAGLVLFVLLVALVLRIARMTPFYGATLGVVIGALALFGAGVWLARTQREIPAGLAIVGGVLLAIIGMQIGWERTAGLDPVVMALFGADAITVGLAGVLGNFAVMFSVTALDSLCAALICLVLPVSGGLHGSGAVAVLLIVIAAQWIVALLYFGASTLYLQTLHELGDICAAYERARKLDDLKDQFITNVNHELRNPIMALYTYVDTVRLAGAEMAEPQRAALLDQAVEMGDRVIALIESILDVRRIDQGIGAFDPVPVMVRAAVLDAATLVGMETTQGVKRDLRLAIPDDLAIWGDATLLSEILTNLLSNAIKYSAPGTPITVSATILPITHSLRRTAGTQPMAQIAVRDFGLGIPSEQISLLFQRFVRLERDLASSVIGNGLGLHLCRMLAEAMGGDIRVESTGIPGEGSTFFVRLPLPPVAPAAFHAL